MQADDSDPNPFSTEESLQQPPAATETPQPQPEPSPVRPAVPSKRSTSVDLVLVDKDAIQIVDAVKTSEGAGSSYIVYLIHFESVESRRRYSDFHSLRLALAALHPCVIVPPLPPKNSLSSYAIAGTNPSKAKEDASLVSRRKRMLGVFLNRCNAHKVLRNERVFKRFLEKDVPWSEVINSPPVTLLPKNQLRAPASDPTSSALLTLFAALPLPTSGQSLNSPDQRFLDSESFTNKFSNHLAGSLEKVNRRLMKRWNEVAGDWGEMGGGLNGFALRMGEEGDGGLEEATEKVGMAVDGGYTSTNVMLQAWEKSFTEPLAEYTQFSGIIKSLLKYRHMKHVQYEMTRELLEVKKSSLEELERSELEAQRLEKALERVRIVSEDGNSTERVIPRGEEGPVGAGSVALGGAKKGGFGLLGALSHTFHGMVDVDPESSRRNSIGKTRESIQELEEALKALTTDLRFASQTIQSDLDRFQRQKVADIRLMCLEFTKFHRDWSAKNLALWKEARKAIDRIDS